MPEIEARDAAWQRLNPQHLGSAIADACIGPDAAEHGGAANVSAAAEHLGVDRKTLSRVIHGHCAILAGNGRVAGVRGLGQCGIVAMASGPV